MGKSIRDLEVPREAAWPQEPAEARVSDHRNLEDVRRALAAISGADSRCSLEAAAMRAAVLWKLNQLLVRRPLSVAGIVERIIEEVPERQGADPAAVRREVEAALVAGAALPDGTPGALRLRTHRFICGGWQFHRCVDADCGRLYPMGEEQCSCGKATAPLYLCRSCGADTLRFREQDPSLSEPLLPYSGRESKGEWLLYDRGRQAEVDDEDDFVDLDKQMKNRPVLRGSFEPATCAFSPDESTYPVRVVLAPARNRCLVCGSSAGPRSIMTPVALGTSAAIRVVSEGLVEGLSRENQGNPERDGKERLLIFSDSRQDAAHQARFINYAGRYDRMRRRLIEVLEEAGGASSIDSAVRELMVLGVKKHDNPQAREYEDPDYLPEPVQRRAMAWEEAPLLDDLAVSAGYRATVINLGLVGVRYQSLDRHVEQNGTELASTMGISSKAITHLATAILDEMRRRGALSRSLLAYHPGCPSCPEEFKAPADWERRVKKPVGYPCTQTGSGSIPLANIDTAEVPEGIIVQNVWRKSKTGVMAPPPSSSIGKGSRSS